jgi:ABC-type branched-subunit amino acid transport system ATPase component
VTAVSAQPILEVEGLVKHFGGVHAVDGVSFTVERGSITGIIGPNGAGKSTVLAVVSGFLQPTDGRVRFDGQDVTGLPMHRLARRGLVRTFQLARVFGGLTALENLAVAAPHQLGERALGVLGGRWSWGTEEPQVVERAQRMLQTFGLADKENDLARNLSGGQRRAVEIMRVLMAEPKLLVLDEPMAGLSPALSRQLEEALMRLVEDGLSLLIVEHELDTVDRICGKVVVMAQGRVLAQGKMAEHRLSKEVQDAYVLG